MMTRIRFNMSLLARVVALLSGLVNVSAETQTQPEIEFPQTPTGLPLVQRPSVQEPPNQKPAIGDLQEDLLKVYQQLASEYEQNLLEDDISENGSMSTTQEIESFRIANEKMVKMLVKSLREDRETVVPNAEFPNHLSAADFFEYTKILTAIITELDDRSLKSAGGSASADPASADPASADSASADSATLIENVSNDFVSNLQEGDWEEVNFIRNTYASSCTSQEFYDFYQTNFDLIQDSLIQDTNGNHDFDAAWEIL